MQKIFIVIFLPLLFFLTACDNPTDNGGASGAYIEGSTFIHPAIKFSITYPSTWLMTLDTSIDGVHYDLYVKKPLTDSVISTITIIKGITTRYTDSILTAEERILSQSLEDYNTVSKTGGVLGYNYSDGGVLKIGQKVFSIKGEYLVILCNILLANPSMENVLAARDIIISMKFE
jgi:hypothetical protein